jgi:hypothetical protein
MAFKKRYCVIFLLRYYAPSRANLLTSSDNFPENYRSRPSGSLHTQQ